MLRAVPWRLWWLALAGCVGGCEPDTGGLGVVDAGRDAPDARRPDAGGAAAGLILEWKVVPALPAALPGDVRLTEVRLNLRDVRVLGDSAPGDGRTAVDRLELTWRVDQGPAPLAFLQAPPGLYSSLRYRVGDGDEDGIELSGTVRRDGEDVDFEIEDSMALGIDVPLSLELTPGEQVTLEVRLDTAAVLGGIDWSEAEVEDGEIKLDDDSAQLQGVRDRLRTAFSVVEIPE
jgi:hypothetical protein